MAIRMRKYSMGLVETDSKTDKGKHAGRAAFKWIIRSILRGQQGSARLNGVKWKNPASPDVLRALPWEFGDDVFTPSPPSPPKQNSNCPTPPTLPADALPNVPDTTSASPPSEPIPERNRSFSTPDPTHDIPIPEALPPPKAPMSKSDILLNDPLYRHLLKVKPTTLPEVFVKESEAYNKSAEEAMMSSRGEIIDPASLSRQELLRLVGNKGGEYSKGPKGSMSASPLSYSRSAPSAKDKERARQRARERASMMDETDAKFGVMPVAAAMVKQAKAEEAAAAARTSDVSSRSSSTPWRAKSSPELNGAASSRGSVRFQVDAAFNAIRPRRSSTKVSVSSTEPAPPLPPPRSTGPPSIPPLDIPHVSSLTGAAEDILRQSLESSVGEYQPPSNSVPVVDDSEDGINAAAILRAAEEMRASRNVVMEMTAAQTIEWIIESSAKKKQE